MAELGQELAKLQGFRWIIQWKITHRPLHRRVPEQESPSARKCFALLEQTSRTYSTLIQEIHPELRLTMCIFYLVMRGLDTVEDDMSLSTQIKVPLLRHLKYRLDDEGWCFRAIGSTEKDREVLVHFSHVIQEYHCLKPFYQEIIKDTCGRTGHGMAEFCSSGELITGVHTAKRYNMYCYYVAGVIGEGLTQLLCASGHRDPVILMKPQLHQSMGFFLQKASIIRDIKEDYDDGRRFWPREVWSKYVEEFEDLFEEKFRAAALDCTSEMVLEALSHVSDCLPYLAAVKEQSVFVFLAMPHIVAIATLALCFRNAAVFQRTLKITKGEACQLSLKVIDLQRFCDAFKQYVLAIQRKNDCDDPNFSNISVACKQIQQAIASAECTQVRANTFQQKHRKVEAGVAIKESFGKAGFDRARSSLIQASLAFICLATLLLVARRSFVMLL